MNTDKEFVPYQIALDMKELGFDEPCFTFYPKEGKMGFDGKYHSIKEGYKNSTVNAIWIKRYKKDFECVAAPTFSQAFRWFREKHDLYHVIKMFGDWDKPQFSYIISGRAMTNPAHMWHYEEENTYEEAELECLKKLIEIVNNNK
jgi:hypothetical protein